MVVLSIATLNFMDIKIKTIRTYNSLKMQADFVLSKQKSNSLYGDKIVESAFYVKTNKDNCCSHLCMSKIPLQSIVENKRKFNLMNGNSRREFVLNFLASNALMTK